MSTPHCSVNRPAANSRHEKPHVRPARHFGAPPQAGRNMATNAASPSIDAISRAGRSAGVAGGWGAVLALTLCVATLIASEFMPVSILTPIATDLHLTEGAAGQAISVSGLFAVLT